MTVPTPRFRRLPPALVAQTLLMIALFFAALAPTLTWPQFSGDSEDLVVQTVLQIRNGGPWWIPMLGDEPRSKKPPLPTWISAAAVTRATMRDLPSTSPEIRESAYRWLAWEVRWPSLLAGCGMMLAVAALAQFVGGPAHVTPSVLIFGTSLMFLRFTRSATTDVHLTLWVLVANAFIALAVIRGKHWAGCVGAGAAIGLAFMCKGPVALVMTLLPLVVYLPFRRPSRIALRPILSGVAVALAIALPWPLSVFLRTPHALSIWLTEIDRRGAAVASHAPWWAYVSFLPNLLPWLVLFVAGIYLMVTHLRPRKPMMLALLLIIAPIVFLSFFPDRKERYLMPLAGPAAILASHAATRMKRSPRSRNFLEKLVWISFWATLLILALGVPVAARLLLKDRDGVSCCSIMLLAAVLVAGVSIVLTGIWRQSHWRQSFLLAGASLMLLLNAFFIFTWSQSVSGLSEMKPLADRLHAGFPGRKIVYFDPPPNGKPVTLDLDIFLDRPVPVLASWPADDASVAAVVVLKKANEPLPEVPHWRSWCDLISRNHHWYVFVPAGN